MALEDGLRSLGSRWRRACLGPCRDHKGGSRSGEPTEGGARALTGVSGAAASRRTWPTPLRLGNWPRSGWEWCLPLPKGQKSVEDNPAPPTRPHRSPLPPEGASRRSTHHMLRLQVSLQLLPEQLSAELHHCSPDRAAALREESPVHTGHATSALTDATSAESPTSALTTMSVNPALPPSCKPTFPTVLRFRAPHQLANQSA